jgi:hypothetical protein
MAPSAVKAAKRHAGNQPQGERAGQSEAWAPRCLRRAAPVAHQTRRASAVPISIMAARCRWPDRAQSELAEQQPAAPAPISAPSDQKPWQDDMISLGVHFFHAGGIGVHGDVHRADAATEHQQRDAGEQAGREQRQRQQQNADAGGHHEDAGGAAPGDDRAGDGHGDQRADADEQDHQAKLAFGQARACP